MATSIFKFDGTLLTSVQDGTVDTTHATIRIPGRTYQPYGEVVTESIVWILENFSGTSAPPNPLVGQLWYDTAIPLLKVWNGGVWVSTGAVINSATAPPGSLYNPGTLWYDTVNQQLSVWNTNSWKLVGPLGSAVNTDPTNPAIPTYSAIDAAILTDTSNVTHQVWRITVGGVLFAIVSKDNAFTPQPLITGFTGIAGDNRIYPGINFNSVSNNSITIAGDSNLFKGNQNNLPVTDNTYNLGSSSKRFANTYANKGVYNFLGVGVAPSLYSFQVNGNSFFNGPTMIGSGTGTSPTMQFDTDAFVNTRAATAGAIEFTGSDFVFTNLVGGVPTRQIPLYGSEGIANNRYYVTADGNDANTGSINKPFRTLKKALSVSIAGDTVFLGSGDYTEHNPLYVPPRVSVVGDNLRRVTIRPLYPTLDILHVDIGSYVYGVSFRGHRSVPYSSAPGIPRAPAAAIAFKSGMAIANMNNGSVTSVAYRWSYSGYTAPPTVFIEPPATGGAQAIAVANLVNGIQEVIVSNGGANFTAPTVVATDQNTQSTNAILAARVSNGSIVAIDVLSPGSNYTDGANVTITISDTTGSGAATTTVVGTNMIGSFNVTTQGSGYTYQPVVSIPPPNPSTITSSPYIQNCSSITGPFDTAGSLITSVPPYDTGNVDVYGSGCGTFIDGQVVSNASVIRSMVCDAFTQINQGGIGHLILNRGYAQYVSCFTTFSSVGYWTRCGGTSNISNSVIDFGLQGIRSSGYYPIPYASGRVNRTYTSTVAGAIVRIAGSGYAGNFPVTFDNPPGGYGGGAAATAIIDGGKVSSVQINSNGSGYTAVPAVNLSQSSQGSGAQIDVLLASPNTLTVKNLSMKPENGTAAFINNTAYTVIGAASNVYVNGYDVTIEPAITTVAADTPISFYTLSTISTGGLALEYPGSGVTYNSLPTYGGIPDNTQKVVTDGPGKVYYVTIDNTGNFNVGPFFGVDFATGTVTLNAKNINLSGLSAIGPFSRDGVVAGVQLQEVSDDTSLTHVVPQYDHTTAPTQFAVKGYVAYQFANLGSLVPAADDQYLVGLPSKRWHYVYATNLTVTNVISGSINGNAATATNANHANTADTAAALATARRISLGGAITGYQNFDGSTDIAIPTTAAAPILRNASTGYTGGGNVYITGTAPTTGLAPGDIWLNTNNSTSVFVYNHAYAPGALSGLGGGATGAYGYRWTPDGFFEQWGEIDGISLGQTTYSLTLPVAFDITPFGAQFQDIQPPGAGTSSNWINSYSLATNSWTIWVQRGAGAGAGVAGLYYKIWGLRASSAGL